MENFKSVFEAFLKKELKSDELALQLEQALHQASINSEDIKTYLTDLHNANKLSLEDYSRFKNQIEQSNAAVQVSPRSKQTSSSPNITSANTSSGTQLFDSSSKSSLRNSAQWDDSEEIILEPGVIIRDNYRLVEVLGKGGMGVVWKASDLIQEEGESRDSFIAIKFLSQDFKQHPHALKALVREFARYKRLIHPNIIGAYELSRTGKTVFIVMEFLKGIPLKKFIRNHSHGISFEEAKPIIEGMVFALSHAHKEGIAHLDFKPANVFYDPEQKIVKVIDFGIARPIEESEREKTRFDPGKLEGLTETYASREMFLGLDPDPRDDIYGLACVTYELLSGKHPFDKKTAAKAEHDKLSAKPIKGLNRQQNQALFHALAFKREDRTPTVDKFLAELFTEKKKIPVRLLAAGGVLALLATLSTIAVVYYYMPHNSNEGNKPSPSISSQNENKQLPPKFVQEVKNSEKGYGQLNIITRPPGFEIYINGEKQQSKTPVAGLQVPAGQIKIKVVNNDEDIERTIEITLLPNETKGIGNDDLDLPLKD
jgi:serine/threonine protein kinase